jgi:hypothetical protein
MVFPDGASPLTRSARPLPAALGLELRLAPGEAFARSRMPDLCSFHACSFSHRGQFAASAHRVDLMLPA